jgi:carbon-monoxide dehydrogenase medium subunit
MNTIQYLASTSIPQAQQWLHDHEQAKILAGGMTLIPSMKHRLIAPEQLIDIAKLADLQHVVAHDHHLQIGAAVTHQAVADSEVVVKTIPGLAQLAAGIGDPQVRARGTIGGSVANNDPAADYPAALLALGATVVTTQRELHADDFFLGMFSTALAQDEIITAVRFPIPLRSAYAKFRHPASGYAMAGVYVAQFASGFQVAVTGAADGVFRWSEAEAALPELRTNIKLQHPGLLDDLHAPAAYRAQLASVMLDQAFKHLI